jgi:REP element-mobilizing transposase RayT
MLDHGAQLELGLPEPKKRGGKRDGAGRPKLPGAGVSHDRRAKLRKDHPVHVTLRAVRAVGHLRAKKPFVKIRDAIRDANESGPKDFRVVHFSVQRDHLHLIVEAAGKRALSRGMQGLGIRIAKAINRLLFRRGPVFGDRYHRHDLKSRRETRNAIAYVLQNFRKHCWERGQRCPAGWIDDCSSGEWFDGWQHDGRRQPPPDHESPVARPTRWMLRVGWQRYGLISANEIPGRSRKR